MELLCTMMIAIQTTILMTLTIYEISQDAWIYLYKMVKICIVEGCKSEYHPDCGLSFHKLPKTDTLREKWLCIIPSGNRKVTQNSVICSKHFMPEDYIPNLSRPVQHVNVHEGEYAPYTRRSNYTFELYKIEVFRFLFGLPLLNSLEVLLSSLGLKQSDANMEKLAEIKTENEDAAETKTLFEIQIKLEPVDEELPDANDGPCDSHFVAVKQETYDDYSEAGQSSVDACATAANFEDSKLHIKLEPSERVTVPVETSNINDIKPATDSNVLFTENNIPTVQQVEDNSSKQFACNFCDYKCTQRGYLVSHMRTHTGEKPYACKHCLYRSSNVTNLKYHMMTHTGEKPHSCNYCSYTCRQASSLKKHLRTHTGEKPYSCQHCDYKASNSSCLIKHVRTHTGEKPYSCQFCDHKCSKLDNLKHHLLVHSGVKPYACQYCEYKCTKLSTLRNHTLSHTEEKRFSCQLCDYKCTLAMYLKRHMVTHSGEKKFSCDKCKYKTSRKDTLSKHMKKHGNS